METETTVESDCSSDSEYSDEEFEDCKLKAKKPQEHKDAHGRRGAVCVIATIPTV
jgi:hypothetical protein